MTRTPWISARIAALAAALVAAPAMANEGHQIAVYGEVAPRCWVADPGRTSPGALPVSPRGRVLCNQAQPLLLSELRAIGSDGALVRRVETMSNPQPLASSLPPRTAIEIVVSPQI